MKKNEQSFWKWCEKHPELTLCVLLFVFISVFGLLLSTAFQDEGTSSIFIPKGSASSTEITCIQADRLEAYTDAVTLLKVSKDSSRKYYEDTFDVALVTFTDAAYRDLIDGLYEKGYSCIEVCLSPVMEDYTGPLLRYSEGLYLTLSSDMGTVSFHNLEYFFEWVGDYFWLD